MSNLYSINLFYLGLIFYKKYSSLVLSFISFTFFFLFQLLPCFEKNASSQIVFVYLIPENFQECLCITFFCISFTFFLIHIPVTLKSLHKKYNIIRSFFKLCISLSAAFITSFIMFLDALFKIDLQNHCKCLLLAFKNKIILKLNLFLFLQMVINI